MKLKTRMAEMNDFPLIRDYDEFIGDRRIDLQRAELLVCDIAEHKAVSYARVSTSHFFEWPFLVFICTEPAWRRHGAAMALVRALTANFRATRLYTSTEESNEAMRSLLAGVAAEQIGYLDRLNFDGEREVVYRLI